MATSMPLKGSFTCRKSVTWDQRLYFPSKGRRAEDFFALKNPTASAGFEPTNVGTKSQHATSRPTKPLLQELTCYWQYSVSKYSSLPVMITRYLSSRLLSPDYHAIHHLIHTAVTRLVSYWTTCLCYVLLFSHLNLCQYEPLLSITNGS
jgi:hypothetical protein